MALVGCAPAGPASTPSPPIAALIPQLQRAVQLQLRLADIEGPTYGSAEILNRLTVGVLLVDAAARVLFANRAAEDMLRARGGLVFGRGGLRAEIPGEARRLRQIIADCAEPRRSLGGAGGRLRLSREHGLPMTVVVAPHRARYDWIDVARPRAMVFIIDPETNTVVHQESLRADFGLTTGEAAVGVEILKAGGLQAAATRLANSLATARTHLAHVFDKTGAHRQSEFAAGVTLLDALADLRSLGWLGGAGHCNASAVADAVVGLVERALALGLRPP
jgi:hypothetical protein